MSLLRAILSILSSVRARPGHRRRALPEGDDIPPGSWIDGPASTGGAVRVGPTQRELRVLPLPGWHGLRQEPGSPGTLTSLDLPRFERLQHLLDWLELDVRWYVKLSDPADRVGGGNYTEWTVPKRRSGVRVICAPRPMLKSVQRKIHREILDRVLPHEAAHGFVHGRGIVSNATPHVGRSIVLNIDLVHFFEYLAYPRVVGVFRWLGYSSEISRALARLCTHRPELCRSFVTERGRAYLRRPQRHAVQGAPTSPPLSNLARRPRGQP